MRENVIKRDRYLNQLISKQNNGAIKIVTGLRRSGKSYLLFNLFYDYLIENGVSKDCIIRLALDDEKNAQFRDPDKLSSYLYSQILENGEKYYVFLTKFILQFLKKK